MSETDNVETLNGHAPPIDDIKTPDDMSASTFPEGGLQAWLTVLGSVFMLRCNFLVLIHSHRNVVLRILRLWLRPSIRSVSRLLHTNISSEQIGIRYKLDRLYSNILPLRYCSSSWHTIRFGLLQAYNGLWNFVALFLSLYAVFG
jgi:hypothetical protein